MKKMILAIGLMVGIAQSSLMAANYYGSMNECCEEDCCIDWCDGWSVYADYLYWNVRKCNLDYAVSTIQQSVEDADLPTPHGKLKGVDPDYSSGFRVGVMKDFCNWNLGVRYTNLCTTDDSSFDVGTQNNVAAPTRLYFGLFADDLFRASASYKVDLDVLDIEFGRDYQPWCKTALRLFGGVKLSRIDQRFNVDMVGVDVVGEDSFAAQRADVDMNAGGLYIGARGLHNFWDACGCGQLGIFGDFSIGGLVGDITRKLKTDVLLDGNPVSLVDVREDCCRLIGNFNIAAGLTYSMSDFFCGSLAVSVGYEMNLWVNTADFLGINLSDVGLEDGVVGTPNISTDRSQDTLGFDGLVVRFAFGF